ncbi:hypothetical protein KVR01_006156 [Diaporthe batatas]|uniref:uncharacterized protein n=1 Tax=Diaporthe batatas TaxID=748121 RepID=UPI001D04935F|nr:uncharacterized protein KVR01_006156 [Diaporthe batatas]KAG8164238.1 hypothetical protein KVR01_006156 [Diaporthe batatas]
MATIDPTVSEATIDDNLPGLQQEGFETLPNPTAFQKVADSGPAVYKGEGQMIFWKECSAYYMTPSDKKWKKMPSTGQLPLQVGWQAYLTGGTIWCQRKYR